MLDKGKIEQVLLNQGLSTRRSKKLAEILVKSDLLIKPDTSRDLNVVEEDVSEVISSRTRKNRGVPKQKEPPGRGYISAG